MTMRQPTSPDVSKHASRGTDPIITDAFRRYADWRYAL